MIEKQLHILCHFEQQEENPAAWSGRKILCDYWMDRDRIFCHLFPTENPWQWVATSWKILGHPSPQNRLANATPIVPQPPCVRATSPHHRKLGAGFAALPQMAGRCVRYLRCIPSGASARRVCCERRTPNRKNDGPLKGRRSATLRPPPAHFCTDASAKKYTNSDQPYRYP